MEIVPLTLAVWSEAAELLGSVSDSKWCWCQFWRRPGSNWSNTTPDDNRAALLRLASGEGAAPGLVALEAGKAVGWVGLGPREGFERLPRSRTLPQLPGQDVWVINCFVVAKGSRRSGVASALLEAATAYARDHGAGTLEGYPVDTRGTRIASASVYSGTAAMFERAGFAVVAETSSKASAGTPRVVMRRAP